MDQTLVQIVVGYIAAFVIERLKTFSWFPIISEDSLSWVKRLFSWVVAAGSALAITFSFDPTLGRLVIDGLTWSNVKGGLTAFIVSLIAQKITYRVAIAPKVVTT